MKNTKKSVREFEYLIVKNGGVIAIEQGFYRAVFAASTSDESPELGAHIAGAYQRASNLFVARNGMRLNFNRTQSERKASERFEALCEVLR